MRELAPQDQLLELARGRGDGATALPRRMSDPGVPAGEVEAAVINQVRALLRAPEVVVRTWRAACLEDQDIDERVVVEALQRLDPLWDQLFPAEQARILQLLVARVVVRLDGLEIASRAEGIASVVEDLQLKEAAERQAA